MTDRNGSKATIREVRDLIDKLDDEKISPMKVDIAGIKKDVENISNKLTDYCTNNRNDHRDLYGKLDSKVSTKAFGAWLGSLCTIITIILLLIGFIR